MMFVGKTEHFTTRLLTEIASLCLATDSRNIISHSHSNLLLIWQLHSLDNNYVICNCEKLILKNIADILLSEKHKVHNRVHSMIPLSIKFYLKSIIYIYIFTHTDIYTYVMEGITSNLVVIAFEEKGLIRMENMLSLRKILLFLF